MLFSALWCTCNSCLLCTDSTQNTSVCVRTHICIYSLPHTHALGPSRCSSPHLFKNLSVIRTIQLFFGYGGQREGWLGRQWSAYSPSPSLFCISQLMIDSSRLQRPSTSYTTAESVNWGGGRRRRLGTVCICGAECLDLGCCANFGVNVSILSL